MGGGYPGRTCRSMEKGAHSGVVLLARFVILRGSALEQLFPEGLHTMKETHVGAVHQELPVGRTHAGAVNGRLSPMRGTPRWNRRRTPLSDREATTETAQDWLTFIPCLPIPFQGERCTELGIKLSLERREEWGEDGFKIFLLIILLWFWLVIN